MSEVVRIDWMMLNIPTILVGVVTNPFKNSYFRGDAFSPTETISTCSGIYGKGAYLGFPGELLFTKLPSLVSCFL